MISLLALLTVIAQLLVASAATAWLIARLSGRRQALDGLRRMLGGDGVRLAWLVATVATAGSLYMSEIRHFQPCPLCWYQRIAMYPLVVVLGVAMLRGGRDARWYAMPLALIGAAIAAYHYQLERFPDQEQIACSLTTPCTTIWFEQLGYITIPMMALSGFALIVTLLALDPRRVD